MGRAKFDSRVSSYTLIALFAMLFSAVSISPRVALAEDPPAAETPISLEKHKVGKVIVETPGIELGAFNGSILALGAEPTPEHVANSRSGKLKWITASGGKGSKYQFHVPENYDPSVPHGLLVYISSGEEIGVPAGYATLLAKYHLIGVSAENNGNKQEDIIRHARAAHAVFLAKERYNVDPERIYASGVSGGGKVASQLMVAFGDLFTGGIPIIGALPCIPMNNFDSKGTGYKDPGLPKINANLVRRAATNGRFAFVTGDKDFNQKSVKAVHDGYKATGFQYVLYIEQPGLAHAMPSAANIEEAVKFLDAPLVAAAPKQFEDAKKQLEKRPDQALMLFRAAVAHGGEAEFVAEAKTQAEMLQKRYEEDLAAAQELVRTPGAKGIEAALAKLKKQWATVSKDDCDRLIQEIKEARVKAKAGKNVD